MIAGGIPAHTKTNTTAAFPAKLKQARIRFRETGLKKIEIIIYNKKNVHMLRSVY
jgi:hypothetical protein